MDRIHSEIFFQTVEMREIHLQRRNYALTLLPIYQMQLDLTPEPNTLAVDGASGWRYKAESQDSREETVYYVEHHLPFFLLLFFKKKIFLNV